MLETSSIGKNSEDLQLLSMSSVSSSSSNLLNMEAVPSPPQPPSTGKRDRRHSPAAFNIQTTTVVEHQPMSPSSSLSGGDATFEPTIEMMVNDFDDEQTLNEEESLANLEALNPEDEIATLKEESEMPLSELLAKYGALPPPPMESGKPSTRKRRRRHSNNKRKLEQTNSEGIEDTVQQEPQSPPPQEHTAGELSNQNETTVVCLGTDEENHTKPDLKTSDLDEEMAASTSVDVAPAEMAMSHQPDLINTKRSQLLDLYPDERCFDESTTTKHKDEQNYDLPLEMLYDDVDDEEEEEEDVDAEDVRKTIMIGISYQADIPDGLSQYGDDVLPYENEDKLIWEPCQVSEHQVEEFLLKVNEIKQPATDDEEQPPPLADEDEPKDTEDPSCSDQVTMDKLKTPNNETQNDKKLSLNTVNTESDSSGLPSVVKDNEQALHLLVQCGYDFKEALRRKRLNVLPLSDCMSSWSEDECQKFEEGIQKFGKDFLRIRQHLVRTRNMREMVQFYYLWKKSERRDQSCANADTIDQMDVYLNESGGDIVGCSSNAMQNGGCGPSTTNSSSESLETKKLQAKNYSIMMIGSQSQSNCSSSTETSETTLATTPLVTTPLSSANSNRKRIAAEQDNKDTTCNKNDSSN